MERLTETYRNSDGTGISKKSLVIEEGLKKGFPSGYCSSIVTKLADYEDAEEQGLLLRNPKDLEDAIINRMQEFYDEWRSISQSSVDHFGGKADAMEVAQKIVRGAFKSCLEEAEQKLASMQKGNEYAD